MLTSSFWKKTAERAVKTVAQTLLATLTVGTLPDVALNWRMALLAAGLAGLVSVLTSVASTGTADQDSPSLVKE